eukprot:gene7759-9224_t
MEKSSVADLIPVLSKKSEIDGAIREVLDKRDVSKFSSIFLVDVDAEGTQTYVKYFDITIIPAMVFFFNCEHIKMDCGYVSLDFGV